MPINEENPLLDRPYWARQKYETHNAYQYFEIYMLLPYGAIMPGGDKVAVQTRSLQKVADLFDVSIQHIGKYSRDWAWVERCRYYDEKVRQAKEEERERVRRSQAREMERRALTYRNDAADLYGEVIAKIRAMLAFPIAEEEIIEEVDGQGVPTGKVTHVLKPAKWNANTISRLIKSLTDLGDVATGRDQQGALDKLLERIDPASLTSEQRQAILDGEDIINVILTGGTSPVQDTDSTSTREPAKAGNG